MSIHSLKARAQLPKVSEGQTILLIIVCEARGAERESERERGGGERERGRERKREREGEKERVGARECLRQNYLWI